MNDKLKELKRIAQAQFGKENIFLMGEEAAEKVEILPTSIYSLDRALGIGGFARGRMVEIFGSESAGKTSLALYAAAKAQEAGGIVVFIDTEHALDMTLAKLIGVKTDELLLSQPDTAEEALEIAEHFARSGEIALIILDSVAALVPKAEVDGEMGDSHMALVARLMSQACRKLTGVLAKSNTTMIWINQIRSKIGVFFGNPETTTGGNALRFYSSQRLEVKKGLSLKEGDNVIGHNVVVKVVKNKLATPFQKATFPIMYGHGADLVGDIFDLAVTHGLVEKNGSWFSYNGEKIGQGRNNSVNHVAENVSILKELRDALDKQSLKLSDKDE